VSNDSIVQIIRRSDGSFVDANLVRGVKPQDLLIVEREWIADRTDILHELLDKGVARENWPQSLHWNWQRKAPELTLLAACGLGVVCERQWQGVMMTKSAPYVARLGADRGQPLIYIDYIETAPRNWPIPEIGCKGVFRGIGSLLFWEAVRQSREEGFHGRIGLHALPQAEVFYQQACQMTPLGHDAAKQNLLYFELSRQQAERLFQARGEQ